MLLLFVHPKIDVHYFICIWSTDAFNWVGHSDDGDLLLGHLHGKLQIEMQMETAMHDTWHNYRIVVQ